MLQENTPARVGLLDLLRASVGVQFVIPVYQRNYTWTANREVKQLLEDIKAVLTKERTKHFIGIIIYLERSLDFSKKERSVIDGQQRLTTLFLLLYAIRELMISKGLEKEVQQLETLYLLNPYDESLRYKLKPLVSDDVVYQQIVQREFDHITEKESNVWQNFKYIKHEIAMLAERYSLNDILMVLNNLYLICVPISNDDYPQKIFESINATGAKLTASDLIRNFMLMPIDSSRQEEYYSKYWQKLEQLISKDSKKLEEFFRFFLMAKRQDFVKKNNVYHNYVEWFLQNENNQEVEVIFKEVIHYAHCYNSAYQQPVSELDTVLQEPIKEFRYTSSDMPAPLLMEYMSLYKRGDSKTLQTLSSQQLAEIITLLNSYLMRRALCNLDTSDISRYFTTLLKHTLNECEGDYTNIVAIFTKHLVTRNRGNKMAMPDDRRMEECIYNANMYSLDVLKFFFRKLENENNPAPVDFDRLSVEHLMPQKPTKEWYKTLQVTETIYEENLHRLGNLTLASRKDNSKMSNKVWEYKANILRSTSHLKLNEELIKKNKWNINDIEERTKKLIADMIRLYPYPYLSSNSAIISIEETKDEIRYIEHEDGIAVGFFNPSDGSICICKGSILNLSFRNKDRYPNVEVERQMLLKKGVIAYNDNHQLIFVTDYTFYSQRHNATALSPTAALIAHGSRNGLEYWRIIDKSILKELHNV